MTKMKSRDPEWFSHSIFNLGGLPTQIHTFSPQWPMESIAMVCFLQRQTRRPSKAKDLPEITGEVQSRAMLWAKAQPPNLSPTKLTLKASWVKQRQGYALVHQVLSLQRSKRSEKDRGHGRTSKRALKRSTLLFLSLTTFSLVQAKQLSNNLFLSLGNDIR